MLICFDDKCGGGGGIEGVSYSQRRFFQPCVLFDLLPSPHRRVFRRRRNFETSFVNHVALRSRTLPSFIFLFNTDTSIMRTYMYTSTKGLLALHKEHPPKPRIRYHIYPPRNSFVHRGGSLFLPGRGGAVVLPFISVLCTSLVFCSANPSPVLGTGSIGIGSIEQQRCSREATRAHSSRTKSLSATPPWVGVP